MGTRDAAEQLEAAIAECVRLERELGHAKAILDMVRADEREKCARIVESRAPKFCGCPLCVAIGEVVAAIRAQSEEANR